jgi:hypothetical protein
MLPRLSHMQLRFSKAYARTGDPHYAAWVAGYSDPIKEGGRLKNNPAVQEHTRAQTQKFLFEKAGKLAVDKLVKLAGDENPAGIQFKAAQELARLANIAITDAAAEKPPSELTAGELGAMVDEMRHQLLQQREIAARALASLPKEILDGDVVDIFA